MISKPFGIAAYRVVYRADIVWLQTPSTFEAAEHNLLSGF